jgi:hypothetical protein
MVNAISSSTTSLSYRSRDGQHAASWLSRRLRGFRSPRGFHRPLRPLPIYRDAERERATPALWTERIRPALQRSRFLLVVLTPAVLDRAHGEGPNWVERETAEFLDTPQGSNVLLVWAHGSGALPLPPMIASRFPDAGWIDVRRLRSLSGRLLRSTTLGDRVTALAVPALDLADDEIPAFNRLPNERSAASRGLSQPQRRPSCSWSVRWRSSPCGSAA